MVVMTKNPKKSENSKPDIPKKKDCRKFKDRVSEGHIPKFRAMRSKLWLKRAKIRKKSEIRNRIFGYPNSGRPNATLSDHSCQLLDLLDVNCGRERVTDRVTDDGN